MPAAESSKDRPNLRSIAPPSEIIAILAASSILWPPRAAQTGIPISPRGDQFNAETLLGLGISNELASTVSTRWWRSSSSFCGQTT